MNIKTLAQIKQENAEAETVEDTAKPQIDDQPIEEAKADEEILPEQESDAETDKPTGEEESLESWMDAEENPDSGPSFSGSDIAAAKKNLRAKLEKRHDVEVDELKVKIQRLEANTNIEQSVNTGTKPKREDFYSSDDPDDAYEDAVYKWRRTQESLSRSQEDKERNAREYQSKQDSLVNTHYERASELTVKHGITPEAYKETDLIFRNVFESVKPEQGDAIANEIISMMGEGSEKVAYYIGRNPKAQQEVRQALIEDPRGFKVMQLMGKYNAEVSSPTKRVTRAPKPSTEVRGDQANTRISQYQKKYDDAHSKGNLQKAFNLKREAMRNGEKVNLW